MNYLKLLEKSIARLESLYQEHPLSLVERKDSYEALPHFLLAYSLCRELKGDYTRVRIESHFSREQLNGNTKQVRVDIEVGDDYKHTNLIVEVKPIWSWKSDYLSKRLPRIKKDVRKLSRMSHEKEWWDEAGPIDCAMVVPIMVRKRNFEKHQEIRSLGNYCEKKGVRLFCARMFPRTV